jgi:hypothetical protein
MEFGTRSIRSAGNGSGSVEVTLPAAFRGLVGLPCRISLRDGLRPELVLLPELRGARAAFAKLWSTLSTALGVAAESDPPLPELLVTFWPVAATPGGPPRLAWTDGFALADAPQEAPCLARSVAAFAHLLAAPCGIAGDLAAGFGAACGFALAGHAEPGQEQACDIGADVLAREGLAPGASLTACQDALTPAFAASAAPALRLLRDAYLDWTAEPSRHAALRTAWRRGVTLELGGD